MPSAPPPDAYREAEDGTIEKRCRLCEEYKPVETGFYVHLQNSDGFSGDCKACADQERRNRREDKRNALFKRYYEPMPNARKSRAGTMTRRNNGPEGSGR